LILAASPFLLRAGFRHSDLAFIVGMWDRLADECKRVLIEIVQANLTGLAREEQKTEKLR
jgi:hypothetical protein